MKDLYSNLAVVTALAPAVQAAAVTGATIDLQGFGGAVFTLATGAIAGAGDFGAELQHSDTNTGGDFVAVPDDLVISNAPATLTASGAFKLGYRGSKRYVRLALTKEGGTSIAAGAVAILGQPAVAPVA